MSDHDAMKGVRYEAYPSTLRIASGMPGDKAVESLSLIGIRRAFLSLLGHHSQFLLEIGTAP